MKAKYNYIVFNWPDYFYGEGNGDGYNSICFSDLKKIENLYINSAPLEHLPLIFRYAFRTYQRLGLPCQYFYPIFCKRAFDDENLCMLFIKLPEIGYMRWLRRNYPKAKFVLFLRDLYDTKHPLVDYYRNENLVDIWITYDRKDADKYNMIFYPEVESAISISNDCKNIKYDVFFAGKAKDRLYDILDVYDQLVDNGFKCYFFIVGGNPRLEDKRDGIEYANRKMSYKEILENSIQSRCILEINQEGAVGNTARFLEAVIYNKILLTNNESLKSDPYYNPDYIKIFKPQEKINMDFLRKNTEVNYSYKGEFSPIELISFIDSIC